jgi:hypothetical protein
MFSDKNVVVTSCHSHSCYIPHPSHPYLFNQRCNIRWREGSTVHFVQFFLQLLLITSLPSVSVFCSPNTYPQSTATGQTISSTHFIHNYCTHVSLLAFFCKTFRTDQIHLQWRKYKPNKEREDFKCHGLMAILVFCWGMDIKLLGSCAGRSQKSLHPHAQSTCLLCFVRTFAWS